MAHAQKGSISVRMLLYCNALVLIILCKIVSTEDVGGGNPELVVKVHGLPPGPRQLQRMIVDERTGHIFIGATNTIFIRDSDLNSLGTISIGPHNDSLFCLPDPAENCECPYSVNSEGNRTVNSDEECGGMFKREVTDNIVKNLVLEKETDQLIVCTNLYYGYCSKVSLHDYSVHQIFVPIVSNSLTGESVVLIAKSADISNALYVGATRDIDAGLPPFKDQSHMLAVRELEGFDIAHYDDISNSVSFIDVKKELRDKFPVNFKYGFSYNGYSYFLFNRRRTQLVNHTATYISRICQNDPKMQSYTEFQLQCEDKNMDDYNSVISAYVTKVGTDLATDLKLSVDDDVLFALFGVTLAQSFTVASDQTQLCVYSLRNIETMFTEAVRFCFSGIGGETGPDHITEPRRCEKREFELCGKSADNWPIIGRRQIEAIAAYDFSGHRLTSLAVKRTTDNKYTVGYLGNKIGQLKKVTFESKKDAKEFGTQTLGEERRALMKDMFFDTTQTYLYAMNEQQVFKVQLFNCSVYTDCDSCLEAGEPQCGWCILENRCTEKSSCNRGTTAYDWLSYRYQACHAITMSTPEKISVEEVTQTEVILKMSTALPSEITMLLLQCEMSYGDFSESSDTTPFFGGVNCTPFSEAPELPSDLSIDLIEPDIWIKVMEKRWIKKKIVIFDCTRRNNCSSCVSGDLPCLWCSLSNQCLYKRQACYNSTAVLSPAVDEQVLKFSSADLVGSDYCPRVLPAKSSYVVPSGYTEQITVNAKKILDYHKKVLQCRFEFNEGDLVEATYSTQEDTITCHSTTLEYEEEVGSIHVPVDFLWEENKLLDNPDNISVEVYKCEQLAESCGECTLLDPVYRCGWCDDRCTLPEYCVTPSDSKLISTDQICPDPQITRFYPNSGPVLGGTNVTIEGVNLGKKLSDVNNHVSIAGVQCEVFIKQYEPPNKLVCSAKNALFDTSGSVKIVVAGKEKYTAVSQDLFYYRGPITVEFEPQKGPVSGGTVVTVTGQYLDMGSEVIVRINDRKCKVLRRESTSLEFETSAQPAAISDKIMIEFDGTKENTLSGTFAFIEDPRINAVYPEVAILSGGSRVHVNGSYLDSVLTPVFYLEKDGIRTESTCDVLSKKSLECPLTDLSLFDLDPSFEEPANLSYGLKLDGWHADLNELSYDLDLAFHPIKVFPDPIIHMFEDTDSVKPFLTGSRTFEILGEHLEVFETIAGLEVKVGNTSCEIKKISPNMVIAAAPENPSIINEDGNSKVEVVLGNFEAVVGHIRYSSAQGSKAGVIVGILFGVVGTLLVVLLVVLFLRRRKRGKKPNSPSHLYKDNGTVERTNIYAGASNNVEKGEAVPLKDMTGAASGHEEEEEEEVDTDKPFQLTDFLDRIRDPKLRANVEEVIVPSERLDMKEMIGRGNFGCVYMATLKETEVDNSCRVAVKTLQGERLEQHTVEAFLKEGVIMKNFNHPHVLRLLGVCVNNQENPMVILPYMANGDLRSYVKDKKKNFTARQLLHLAQQVAEGMAYLSGLNFVHRDLAARNCMIDEFDVVKVADFGLTRDLFEKQYFSTNLKEKRGKMPIKWMALESLEEFVFTTKSDIWSFGVLMWELMTRGVTPYPDVDIFDVRNYLASGRRLRKPKYCPDNIYNIMLACWHADPDMRPNFIDLVNRVEFLLNPPKRRVVSEDDSGEPMYMNIRKTTSSEYLKPLDGSTSEELLSDNSMQNNARA